ncbi:MAG: lysylphosphatidylglycerol synthase transmembrane domain-containing protein [Kofleriaceae bacterium]
MRSPAGEDAGSQTKYHSAHDPGADMSELPEAPDSKDSSEPEKPESNRASQIFNLVVFVVGGIALWWMLRNLGWTQFLDLVDNVGWWFAVIIGLDLLSLCFDAAALHAFMRPEARMISYLRVLGAQASGRAINVLTPGGGLGEAVKLTMLVRHAPKDRVLSSIVLLNLSMFYISVIVMLIGTPITFLLVDLPDAVKVSVGIGLAVIIPAVIGLGFLIKRGATATIADLIRRTRLISAERSEKWKLRLVEVDKHIRELYKNRSAGTWKGILWVLLSKAMLYTATIILLLAVRIHLNPALVIGVFSVGVLIQWVAQVVPMGLGIADGGNYAMYEVLGSSGAHGMAVTMLNRARSVTVAILGLGAMAAMYGATKIASARMQRKLAALRERAAAAHPS